MPICGMNPYQLPTIDLVGGTDRTLRFHARYYKGNRPFDLTGAKCQFSVVNFTARKGDPVISKLMDVELDEASGVHNILTVDLTKADTLNLFGKFAYQITIVDSTGATEIPQQGVLNIFKNIDTEALS